MTKTSEQLAEETIDHICQSLSDNPLFVDDSFQELLSFVTFLFESDLHDEIMVRLQERPDDKELQKEAKYYLKKHLEINPENIYRLSEILAGGYKVAAKPRFDESKERGFGELGRKDKTEESKFVGLAWKKERESAGLISKGEAPAKPFSYKPLFDKALKEKAGPSDQLSRPRAGQKSGDRFVNTGFSSWDDPDRRLFKKVPLAVGKEYLFCMDIGELWEETLETAPTDIPNLPEKDATISVVVFGFPDGIQVTPGVDRGELKISGGDPARVLRQPIPDGSRKPPSSHLDSCLFFPVVMPSKPEEKARMRCNIYWRNILLQSRLVSAKVVQNPTEYPRGRQKVIRSDLDYCIAGTLTPSHVNQLEPHCMSLLFNSNEDTQSIFIEGSDRPHHVFFRGGEIQDFIENTRKQLKFISWGDTDEWNGRPYLYKDQEPDLERLKKDLISLAKWGYEFYFKTYDRLEGDKPGKIAFEDRMGEPGYIQIAMRRSPNYLIPVAMVYDYPLYISKLQKNYDLCPEFVRAFHEKTPLENTPCFKGDCPTRKRMKELQDSDQGNLCTTICPSGFWGFRHYLGMPISLDHSEHSQDIPSSIAVRDTMIMAVCVSTEVKFLEQHEKALESLPSFVPGIQWNYADEEQELIPTLKQRKPHAIYFYCHGDLEEGAMQLRIGSREKPCMVNTSNLKVLNLIWTDPRPLIFLNGCYTAGISPNQLVNFIEPFVTHSNSAGVIGTEITIFEELATTFSEHFFKHFLEGKPVGQAIRNARLTLLSRGNPLGLVYTPYVLPSLKLVKSGN